MESSVVVGSPGSLVAYNPLRTLAFRWTGTVLPYCWKRCLLTCLLTLPLCFLWDAVRDAKTEGRSADYSASKKLVHHLFRDASEFFAISSGFLTFILGFFNATVFARWWALRDKCGVIMGRTVDTTVLLSVLFDNGGMGSDVCRLDLIRRVSLAHRVALYHAQRVETNFDELHELGLLVHDDESEALRVAEQQGGVGVHVCYGWFLGAFHRALRARAARGVDNANIESIIDDTSAKAIVENVRLMRGAAADLMMFINQPIPLAMAHILEMMVNVYTAFAMVGLVPKLLWVAPPVVAVVNFFYYGFYTLNCHMLDPFHAGSGFGFEPESFFKGTHAACRQVEQLVPIQASSLSGNGNGGGNPATMSGSMRRRGRKTNK